MKFGLSRPVIARRTGKKTYMDGFVCGEAMTTSVNPQYAEASLYGDNKMVASKKKLKNATVSMGTTRLPRVAETVMFGHKISVETGEVVYRAEDAANYVGYGFISKEEIDESIKYIACILYKVMFSEGENSYETEGENINFKTPSVSGTAMPDDDGEWMTRKQFNTEEDAYAWIRGVLNLDAKCAIPEASVEAGTYDAAQSVTLTVPDGGTIYYTTDGTTPGKTNGTKATNTAIPIAKTTMLKAVNTAAGKTDSDIFAAEYIISTV